MDRKKAVAVFMLLLTFWLMPVSQVEAGCKVEEADVFWLKGWTLENDLLKVEIYNPGAQVKNIYLKKSGDTLLNDSNFPAGSIYDVFPTKDYKGETTCPFHGIAKELDWEAKIVENSSQRAAIEFSVLIEYEPSWENYSGSKIPYKGKERLKITRTDSLIDGKPIYKREYVVENIGDSDAPFWYNIFTAPAIGGETLNDRIVSPNKEAEKMVTLLGAGGFRCYQLTPEKPYLGIWDQEKKDALIYLGPFDLKGKLWFKYVHFWGSIETYYCVEPSPTIGIDENIETMQKYGQILKKGGRWNYVFYIIALSEIESEKMIDDYVTKSFTGGGS